MDNVMEIVIKLIISSFILCVPAILSYDLVPEKYKKYYIYYFIGIGIFVVLVMCAMALYNIWLADMINAY